MRQHSAELLEYAIAVQKEFWKAPDASLPPDHHCPQTALCRPLSQYIPHSNLQPSYDDHFGNGLYDIDDCTAIYARILAPLNTRSLFGWTTCIDQDLLNS
jgi:hypothetical protein